MHYLNTAKKLNEEGVDATARIRAVPIAVRLALPDHLIRMQTNFMCLHLVTQPVTNGLSGHPLGSVSFLSS